MLAGPTDPLRRWSAPSTPAPWSVAHLDTRSPWTTPRAHLFVVKEEQEPSSLRRPEVWPSTLCLASAHSISRKRESNNFRTRQALWRAWSSESPKLPGRSLRASWIASSHGMSFQLRIQSGRAHFPRTSQSSWTLILEASCGRRLCRSSDMAISPIVGWPYQRPSAVVLA